ncbi:MAG TPA: DUF6350 family protein [Aeromicrobium sp.]|nr:DUF6350 family protein [Aeromicrobium sp.]HKY56410.1 DUF6350 family protein [Aeromicrobium sp.]
MPDAPRSAVVGGFLKPALRAAAGVLAIGWAASALTMLLSGGSDLRIPARMWLVAHGSGLVLGEARIGVVPLGVTLVVVALTAAIAHRVARAEVTDLGGFAGTVGMTMGIAAAILAAVVSTDNVAVSIPRAAIGGLVVGGLGAALGAGWRHRSQLSVSPDVALVIRGATRALLVVLGASLILVTLLLGVHGQRAADMWGLLDPSAGGAVVLAIACLLSLPTLVLWTASVLVGPGFTVGTDTSVDLTGSYLGAIPGFPTLAAVPDPGAFGPWVLALGLVLPAAGLWAGALTTRVRIGALSGAAAGLVLGALIAVSGGGIGPGRLVDAGPPPVTPAVIAVVILAATGALGSLLAHYRGRRVSRKPSESDRFGLGRWLQSPGSD